MISVAFVGLLFACPLLGALISIAFGLPMPTAYILAWCLYLPLVIGVGMVTSRRRREIQIYRFYGDRLEFFREGNLRRVPWHKLRDARAVIRSPRPNQADQTDRGTLELGSGRWHATHEGKSSNPVIRLSDVPRVAVVAKLADHLIARCKRHHAEARARQRAKTPLTRLAGWMRRQIGC